MPNARRRIEVMGASGCSRGCLDWWVAGSPSRLPAHEERDSAKHGDNNSRCDIVHRIDKDHGRWSGEGRGSREAAQKGGSG